MQSTSAHPTVRRTGEEHSVQFFPSEAARVRGIAKFLLDGIKHGDAVLLICSAENRNFVFDAVGHRFSSEEQGRIHFIDSLWALEKVFVDGAISIDQFRAHIESKVRALVRQFGRLRVYGDVVDELASEGNDKGVLDLESAWHESMKEISFHLHCGYLMENFSSFRSAELFEKICLLHSRIEDETWNDQLDEQSLRELHVHRAKAQQHENALQRESVSKDRLVSLGELAAVVSHELNNPLASILYSTNSIRDWLKSQNFEPAQTELLDAHLRRTENSAHRMVAINNGILAYSKKSNDRMASFALQTVLKQAIDLLVVRMARTAIKFDLSLHTDSEPLLLYGSSVGIEQVVLNLISNAIDSISEKRRSLANPALEGEISISLRRISATSAELVVADNGVGISDTNLPRIFEPFFTTKSAGSATGLGLSLSQKTILHHGGEISCLSTLGRGTAFRCVLPVIVR